MMAFVIAASALVAPEQLTEVIGGHISTPGTASEISARAEGCAASVLSPGVGGRAIVSRHAASGAVVATNVLEYHDGPAPYMLRSRVTIEASQGRFRIRHDAIERRHDQSFGAIILRNTPWRPVGKWWGSGWQQAEAALRDVSGQLAACIQRPPAAARR